MTETDQVKLILTYNVRRGSESAYRRFFMEEFLPQAQALGIVPTDAWHTAYGNYPVRLIGFVAADLATLRAARASDEWQTIIKRLESCTVGLRQRVVAFQGGFQW